VWNIVSSDQADRFEGSITLNFREPNDEWEDSFGFWRETQLIFQHDTERSDPPKVSNDFHLRHSAVTRAVVQQATEFGLGRVRGNLKAIGALMNPVIGSQMHTTGPLLFSELGKRSYVELVHWNPVRLHIQGSCNSWLDLT